MENDILDSLEDLGYSGAVLDDLSTAVDPSHQSIVYTQLVEWLTRQLKQFCGLEEHVNATNNESDWSNFELEVSSFLREYGCPYSVLNSGPINERLITKESRLQLLDYLCTDLAAVRLLASTRPGLLKTSSTDSTSEQAESEIAVYMKQMLLVLGFPKPPGSVSPFQLFSKVEEKIKEIMTKNPGQIGKPLLKVRLSDKQWSHVLKINTALCEEYKLRREMLLKRLDVTIQSFKWSDKAKFNEDKIANVYQPIRKGLVAKTDVGIPQILAARDDLTQIQKTSSGEARENTKCAINKVMIGKVPDRGGRTTELEPPPPEMPSFMQRSAAPQRPGSGRGGGGRGGRGGEGGRGGGRVQGGWGDSHNQNQGGNWQQGGQGYSGQGVRVFSHSGGHQGGGGGYQGGGGGYQSGGGGYQSDGGGYQGGGGGHQGGGGGHQDGGGGYQGGGGNRGGSARGGRGRGRGR